jgi:hypothetical protein
VGCCCVGLFDRMGMYIMFALGALNNSACDEYKRVVVYKVRRT